ncbi:unnamed protein product [Darwinula stevensoni]|uniref:IkappaB kinase n=1 Tax=Darwinula stevensoni TaxID=69355 RepID=A0A7R9A4W0_9CRUS|nr:unnamed protein product [Darwinula stevensoni]CAG0890779.1 unnamed protein product [Darwinula stevensoni]
MDAAAEEDGEGARGGNADAQRNEPVDPAEVESWVKGRILGTGGFGTVTLWKQKTTGQVIALKKCRWGSDQLMSEKQKQRWEKEVEIMLRLSHPCVVSCMPVPEELQENLVTSLPMLCMECCRKGDLRRVLSQPGNCCGLPEPMVRSLVGDIASAVEYLHGNRIIHRDLKPENIVLQDLDGLIVYKLIDLGYAKELDQSSACTSFVGTVQYLAPELFLSRKYSCTVDYWSLGLVTHEAITGVRPFLPNLSPAHWMPYVEKKSSSDICIFQDAQGEVQYSHILFRQNHISRPLEHWMEEWLRLLLEWDPLKRGRHPGSGDVAVFPLLKDMLTRKVLRVFCLPECRWLYYEVESPLPSVEDIQGYVERDMGIPIPLQLLLLPEGSTPDSRKGVMQLWAPPEEEEWYVFIYDLSLVGKGKGKEKELPVLRPSVPPMVEEMLKDPKMSKERNLQKRTWAQAVFLAQSEDRLFHTMLTGLKALVMELERKREKLLHEVEKVSIELACLESRNDLFQESLALDLRKHGDNTALLRRLGSPHVVTQWRKSGEVVQGKVFVLGARVRAVEVQVDAIIKQSLTILQAPLLRLHDAETLTGFPKRSPLAHPQQPSCQITDLDRTGEVDKTAFVDMALAWLLKTKDNQLKQNRVDGGKQKRKLTCVVEAEGAYDALRHRVREGGCGIGSEKENLEMVRIIYHMFKRRDLLHKDFFSFLMDGLEARGEVVRLGNPLVNALGDMQTIGQDLLQCQIQRQNDIWTIVSTPMMGSVGGAWMDGESLLPWESLPHESLLSLASRMEHGLKDSSVVVQENTELRCRMQETWNQVLKDQREIRKEQEEWDLNLQSLGAK